MARLGCERGAGARGAGATLGGRPELKCQVPDVGVGSAAGAEAGARGVMGGRRRKGGRGRAESREEEVKQKGQRRTG